MPSREPDIERMQAVGEELERLHYAGTLTPKRWGELWDAWFAGCGDNVPECVGPFAQFPCPPPDAARLRAIEDEIAKLESGGKLTAAAWDRLWTAWNDEHGGEAPQTSGPFLFVARPEE